MAKALYAGGRLNSVTYAGTVAEFTSGFDASYANCTLGISDISGSYADCLFTDSTGAATTVVTGETLYAHVRAFIYDTQSDNLPLTIYDSNGDPWFGIRSPSSANSSLLRVVYNSGTGGSPVWTTLATFSFTAAAQTIDIKLTLGSPHSFEISQNQTLVASGTFTQASLTNAAKFRLASGWNIAYYSEILCTEGISTIGARVKYTSATGAGSNSDWTGAYTDINEVPLNDTTSISSGTPGQVSTFAWGDVTLPSGYAIKDVFVWSRGKNDGASPTNIKTVIRASGTNYASSNMSGIGTSYGSLLYRTDVNPATSVAWTSAGFNAVEIGFESAA